MICNFRVKFELSCSNFTRKLQIINYKKQTQIGKQKQKTM